MSRIDFHEASQQWRVLLPPLKKLSPNPHICISPNDDSDEILARALAPPSETQEMDIELPTEPRELKGLRHRLLACDQRSFLTGSAAPDLQAVHLINAIRGSLQRKLDVEFFLTQQRLQPQTMFKFALDGINNAILLESSLRIKLNTYGTYCFVPAEQDANAMLDALREVNESWKQANPISCAPRPLDVTKDPFNSPLWDVLVLHPNAMLPEGQPLSIAQNRTFYVKGEPPPQSKVTWTSWTASGDCLTSTSPPHEPLVPFAASNARAKLSLPNISSLAMVVNAHAKLGPFMQHHGASATPRIQKFAQLISELVYEIFFVPEGLDSVAMHVQEVKQPLAAGSKFGDEAGRASALHDAAGFPTTAMEAPEAPEAPDADGLTDTEFDIVSAQARDPHLNKEERADAAMMMLFGTSRSVDPSAERLRAIYG